MYAVVRLNTWDVAKRAAAADDVAEFDRIHAEQPGFIGSLVVDVGTGRNAIVNLWVSEEDATEALPVVGPAVGRLLQPLMAEPSQLIGTGEVIQGAELVHDPA
ncbi:hypothetical protein ACFWN7_10925 [Agromyces sp. NPDC058484]|uniref:hypothetical protein n=1 Tax=Agromyces sp. NPDC058484 TaxID=3346524 RepID=UPI00366995C1